MGRLPKLLILLFIVFAALGFAFSAVSTYDFMAHLDRQVHSVSCSYIPGLLGSGASHSQGCYAVMMSPYSSVLRDSTWGGIPIALPSMSVFAFLIFLGIVMLLKKAATKPFYLAFPALAAMLPAAVSVIYWAISVSIIGTVCKNCIGIYVASFGMLLCAFFALAITLRQKPTEESQESGAPWKWYGFSFLQGVLFVFMPIFVFLALKPAYTDEMGRCGSLIQAEDKYGVKVKLHNEPSGTPAVELVDPLCPACKAFRDRLNTSGLIDKLDLDAVVFPLDNTCNWMVNESLHPGACIVSEAILCSQDKAMDVLNWSLDNQEELRSIAKSNPKALIAKLEQQFPWVVGCVNKPAARSKVNKSLRWIIANSSKVMTPQLFVRGQKLCDEDSDLGLDYALTRMLGNMGNTGGAVSGREVRP